MYANADVLEAARIIRSFLPKMFQETTVVQEIDEQLAQLLNNPDLAEDTKCDQIEKVLDQTSETKIWLDGYLESSEIPKTYLSYPENRIAGDRTLTSAKKYICPINNDYTVFLENTREIPLCPTHLVPLVPAD